MLVISAHAADFVWRAGGAIALYANRGYRVRIACLTYGERGESAKLWKEPDMTLERVKAARQKEAEYRYRGAHAPGQSEGAAAARCAAAADGRARDPRMRV
jgi:LmbE family N-acetylglucosaminyl deacetylase